MLASKPPRNETLGSFWKWVEPSTGVQPRCPWPASEATSCLGKVWLKTRAEGLTEGREEVDKVTEGEKYQGGGQENRDEVGSLRTSHSHRDKRKSGLAWAGPSRCPIEDFGSY